MRAASAAGSTSIEGFSGSLGAPGSAGRGARLAPDRLAIALEQSLGGRTDRGRYGAEADVSPATASADIRRLLDAGFLEQQGQGRGTAYVAGEQLRQGPAEAERPTSSSPRTSPPASVRSG